MGGDGFVGGDGVLAKDKLIWYDENNILPGTYENRFDPAYTDGINLDNYEIACKYGELVVNARADKDKYQVTVTANSGTQMYNGNEYSVSGVSGTTYTNKEGAVFTIEGLSANVSGTDAGEYTNKVTGTAVVKDAQGNDVTSQFKVTTVDGKLIINKREVTIKPKDATKDYDGKKLVATDWEVVKGSLDFVEDQALPIPRIPALRESLVRARAESRAGAIRTIPRQITITSRLQTAR